MVFLFHLVCREGAGGVRLFARRGRDNFPAFGLQALVVCVHPGKQDVDIVATFGGVFGANAVYFLKDFVFFHGSKCHQFSRRANIRRSQPKAGTSPLNAGTDMVIVDVPAIPGQQKIHPVRGGQTDMRRVICRHRRDEAAGEQMGDERGGLRRARQQRNVPQMIQPRGRKMRVAPADFKDHGLGDEQLIIVPLRFPPLLRAS
jgi:hypothetical protein